jgi:zinc-finger-containing domain
LKPEPPLCLHCQAPARLTYGAEIYPHRQDLALKPFWKCAACGSYCGCHPGTFQSLGRPANAETRKARSMLHDQALDPLWKPLPAGERNKMRKQLYRYLGETMGLTPEETHTGMWTIEQCREAWKALKEFRIG